MGADPLLGAVPDRSDVQVGVEPPKGPLDVLQGLVGRDDVGPFERLFGKARAQHVDSVKGGLGGDLCIVALARAGVVCDLEEEVLGHLVAVDHFADAEGDLVLAPQRPALAVTAAAIFCSSASVEDNSDARFLARSWARSGSYRRRGARRGSQDG